jgi:hypothetical protein
LIKGDVIKNINIVILTNSHLFEDFLTKEYKLKENKKIKIFLDEDLNKFEGKEYEGELIFASKGLFFI